MPDADSALLAPALPSQRSLGLALRRSPPLPSALARSLRSGAGAGEFRAIVDLVFPADADALMAADQPPLNRAASRVDAFLGRVARERFAVYQPDFDDAYWDGAEYDQVTRGIPFVRFGWTLEERHELDVRAGFVLLMALCADPDDDVLTAGWLPGGDGDDGWRVALLDALAAAVGLPADTLARVPRRGVGPAELHRRLGAGRFAAATDFAWWFRAETDLACLDLSEDDDYPVPWTRDNVDALAGEWPRAKALLERTEELAAWLEEAPADHFGAMLDALLATGPLPESAADEPTGGEPASDTGAIPAPHGGPATASPVHAIHTADGVGHREPPT